MKKGCKKLLFETCCASRAQPTGKYRYLVPIPSAVAIPFYIGATFSIDFCLGGGAIAFAWRYFAPAKAAIYVIPAGAGLMVGDGLWQVGLCLGVSVHAC